MTLRIDNLRLWDGKNKIFPDASLRIRDGRIAQITSAGDIDNDPQEEERIDGRGKLAIPGFVNAHTHLYSSLARGMAVSPFSPGSFTEILEQLWWKLDKALDPQSVRISALVGAMEAARCGVTTLVDHHASPNAIPHSLDTLKETVVKEVGLRAAFCYELSDRDGVLCRDQGIDENLRFFSQGQSDHVSAQFGIHASFTFSDETLAKVAESIPDEAGIHIHVAEGPEDEVQCENTYGERIVNRLDRFGLLRPQSILAHCLHINEEEKDLIAERESIVILDAPTSILLEPIREMIVRRGIRDFMIVPLKAPGNTIGTINVSIAQEEREFTPTDVKLVETIAGHIAAAIENVRLFEIAQTARKVAEAANRAKSAFLASMSHELRTR